jgi:chemotaxis protein CheD
MIMKATSFTKRNSDLIECKKVRRFLNPSEFHFGGGNCQIHTLLGSCVAITLWHPTRHIGGMCHFLLPELQITSQVTTLPSMLNGRYADVAMTLFENAIRKYGTNMGEYQAKIFGGSNMIVKSEKLESECVGAKNIAAAVRHLDERGVPILVSHVGETGHRRIVFDLSTGDVWVKHQPFDINEV